MTPFEIAVVLSLTVLFIVLSVVPLLVGKTDMDSSHRPPETETKAAH